MKTREILAIAFAALIVLGSCSKEVERRPNSDFSSTTASVSCIDAATSEKDCGTEAITELQVIEKATTTTTTTTDTTSTRADTSSLPEEIIPETSTAPQDTAPAEDYSEPRDNTPEEPSENHDSSSENDDNNDDYNRYMYKPSTHYVHRATCHWVDDTCYEIETTEGLEVRLCTECNPDIEVKKEYKEKKKKKKKNSVPETNPDTDTYENAWPVDKRLNPQKGTIEGPSGKETYYNLDMSGVISIMRNMGFSAKDYPYWVRDDGCKMLGNYIMVAANLDLRPRGSTIATSLGTGLVCDTGGFAYYNQTQLDIATTW